MGGGKILSYLLVPSTFLCCLEVIFCLYIETNSIMHLGSKFIFYSVVISLKPSRPMSVNPFVQCNKKLYVSCISLGLFRVKSKGVGQQKKLNPGGEGGARIIEFRGGEGGCQM